MIKIEKLEVHGFETAVRGMRNSYRSWDKSDGYIDCKYSDDIRQCRKETCRRGHGCWTDGDFKPGKNDLALMQKLSASSSSHRKFMRFITVTFDVTAPLYWWKQFDTYKVGVNCLSTSTMHNITDKEFTLDDFSHGHCEIDRIERLDNILNYLNKCRIRFLKTNNKKWWWQIIQLLPSSYNQLRTIQLNYEVLAAIYKDRQNHELDEWRDFCAFIEKLPYSDIITGRCLNHREFGKDDVKNN